MLTSLRILVLILTLQTCLCAGQETDQPYIYCQKKWRELKWEGMKIQVLKLRAENFPDGKTYTLFIRNFDGSETQVFNYTANKKGHLIIDIEEELKKGLPFAVTPLRRGEKISYCMFSLDRQEEITTSIIPFPIGVCHDEVSLSLELVDTRAETFVCVGQGFAPGEKIVLVCTSGEQVKQELLCTDGQGCFQCPICPSIQDKDTGIATVVVKREKEQISLPLEWGKQAQGFVGAVCLQIH